MKTKLIIFGITGDLSRRKLLPALRHIVEGGENLQIIGVSRREVEVVNLVGDALADRTAIFTMDLADAEAYDRLRSFVDLQEDEQALVYLSVPPSAATDIVDFLGAAGFNSPNVKLLFEKPFGFDLATAEDFLERTARYFMEEQIYRIDHYAAKEVARHLIELQSNAHEQRHNWGRQSIAAVEVIATETIGVEDRAIFYEQTGALRDFVQGHLLQLLALVLMETPTNLERLAAYRLRALEQLLPVEPEDAIRAQYEGYDEEVSNPGSQTETFVRARLKSADLRWERVELTVTTGKALDRKRSQVVIRYTDGTEEIFDEGTLMPSSGRRHDAYERVLLEAIQGNKTLFTSGAEVLRAWEVLAPLQQAWQMDRVPLKYYAQGATVDGVVGVK